MKQIVIAVPKSSSEGFGAIVGDNTLKVFDCQLSDEEASQFSDKAFAAMTKGEGMRIKCNGSAVLFGPRLLSSAKVTISEVAK